MHFLFNLMLIDQLNVYMGPLNQTYCFSPHFWLFCTEESRTKSVMCHCSTPQQRDAALHIKRVKHVAELKEVVWESGSYSKCK